jgi:hypothetical protein
VTLSDLLVQLGLAWPRLLLYPGGLAAFGLVWLVDVGCWLLDVGLRRGDDRRPTHVGCWIVDCRFWMTVWRRMATDEGRGRAGDLETTDDEGGRSRSTFYVLRSTFYVLAVVSAWLGLALLPLPGAAPLAWQTDAIVVLALFELPLWLTIATEIGGDRKTWQRGAGRLAGALNGYPPLLLGLLLLSSDTGTLRLDRLTVAPAEPSSLALPMLHGLGAVASVLALPALLGLGPFRSEGQGSGGVGDPLHTGRRLRGIGLVLLAALPWMPALGGLPWLLPLPALLITAFLWGCHRVLYTHPARRWAGAYLVLDLLLGLALLAGSVVGSP